MINPYLHFGSGQYSDLFIKILIALIFMGTLGPLTISLEGEVPLTLQSFAILLPSILFGWRVAIVSTLIYVIAGASGAPVFASHSSGLSHLFGVTGGFFFGFLIAALITGFLAEFAQARKPWFCFIIWTLGHLIILTSGAIWLRRMNPEGWWDMIQLLLPGAAIKIAFGLLFTQLILRLSMKRESFYASR